jgi:hypothetical protein
MRPPGSIVGLTYDSSRPVEEDDVVITGTGRCYRVVAVRVQTGGKWAGRQHLRCIVMAPGEVTSDDTLHPIRWYRR